MTDTPLPSKADNATHRETDPGQRPGPVSNNPRHMLVACHEVALNGGLLRFDNVAAVLRSWGHTLSFVTLLDKPRQLRPTEVPVLSFEEASQTCWDAVMVPGAAFPEDIIARLSAFRHEQFGVRVQHILNDQQRRALFKTLNDCFSPHVVIFNNEHWPPGSFTEFHANRFRVLLGAVDTVRFRPDPLRARRVDRWIVGGLAYKNPHPLIDTLDFLGPEVAIRLYGPDALGLAQRYADLVRSGRLQLTGPLFGEDLSLFYHGVDCVAMTELMAGWANLAAEAMASGVPVICTRNGTLSFAHHETTALVLDDPSPATLALNIRRLQADRELCEYLSRRGREVIEPFSWETYTESLLEIIAHARAR